MGWPAVLKAIEAQHGIFSQRAQRIYSFAHLTFQEYFTAQYIADTWQLPHLPPDDYDEFLSQEAAQPPLYYILSALLIAPIDTSQARDHVWFNPRVQLGDASSPTNTNAFVHGNWEAFPWQGYALAAHILRIFSTLIGLGTLCFIYASTRLVWTDHPQRALLATALIAFLKTL